MAATVYNGKGNVTHTNSSGGNERIVIYWIYKENSAVVDVKWGNFSGNFNTATMNTNADQYVGKTLAYGMASSGRRRRAWPSGCVGSEALLSTHQIQPTLPN